MRGCAWLIVGLVAAVALISGAIGDTQPPDAAPAAAPTATAESPAPAPTDAPPESTPQPTPIETPGTAPTASADSALALLATLPVKGRAAKTGYARSQFGQRWKDVDRNGCDTRNDILAAQLTDITRRGRCIVLSGTLHDPYSGSTIASKRDGDAATWLPKAKGFRCAYVARQVAVKSAYDLWVTQAEHDAIARILATCPAEPAPVH